MKPAASSVIDPEVIVRPASTQVDDLLVEIGKRLAVGERVLVTIVDEGPGIPRGAEEQLFAPFQRLGDHDNSTGVGLGLSVERGFVEAMGGTISATDTPGGGLTVVVDLAAAGKDRV